jgi:hypothetical protein
MGGRGAIPMTPFPRMQSPQEPVPQETETPKDEDGGVAPEASGTIDIPEMPERVDTTPEPVSMPEPPSLSSDLSDIPVAPPPTEVSPETAAAAAAAAAAANPLARMMRGPGQPGTAAPAQRDLLADLPPPPISEPLTTDTESAGMRRKRRNRRLLAAAAVIVVIALGAWLWTGGEPSTEVPVVTADATPEKVKPADEGGLQVQNQDVQVLDPSTQTQTETVMPEPEQPITPPAADAPATDQAPTVVENADGSTAPTVQAPTVDVAPSPDVPLSETPLPAMEENGTTQPAPAATASEPTQAAEAPAATEAAPAEDTAAQATATPAPAATPEPAPAAAPVAAQPEPTQPEPAQAEPAQAEPAQAAQPEQPAAQETQQAAVTPVAPTGNTRVQLAAGKSEASVQKEWAALQKAHPDLLGSLSLHIERVDKGAAGIFYRLQAGPLADKTAAKELCAGLKQKGQDCLVVAK